MTGQKREYSGNYINIDKLKFESSQNAAYSSKLFHRKSFKLNRRITMYEILNLLFK